ncbi:MAG: hypothetical protein OEV86_05635 [Candidatus Krumholzibacteria bacterium]|nr:hypothetical protein [Candidatus Krumholzibacteria bacterium]
MLRIRPIFLRVGFLARPLVTLLIALTGCSSDGTSPAVETPSTETVARARITFENPAIPPVPITGVACFGNAVAVCGNAGLAAILENGTWTILETGVLADLNTVWGTSSTNMFFAGDQGCFLHWDGTKLRSINTTTDNWVSMWGRASNDIWLVSSSSVLHWNGTTYTYYTVDNLPLPGTYTDVGGTFVDDVFVTGYQGLLHWDGITWSEVATGAGSAALFALDTAGNEVFVAGEDVLLLHYDGASWSSFTGPASFNDFEAVAAIGPNNVFALGDNRLMYRWNGTDWNDVSNAFFGTAYDFYSACSNGNSLVVGGSSGSQGPNVARLTAGVWSALDQASVGAGNFLSVWTLDANTAVAVGEDGVIAKRDAAGWADVPHGLTTEDLSGVWGTSASNVYAVGTFGVVLQSNGTAWRLVDTGLGSSHLNDVTGNGPDDVWIVGEQALWHWDGTAWADRWSELPDTLSRYWTACTTGGGDLFLAGERLLHYDGVSWSLYSIKSTSTASVYDVWAASSSDVWLAGESDVFHWDGAKTEVRWTYEYAGCGAVSGRSGNNVFVGTWLQLIQFANEFPSVVPFPNFGACVYGASTGIDGTTYFVGGNGLIARVD